MDFENTEEVIEELFEYLKHINKSIATATWLLGILILLGIVALYHFW